VDAGCWRWWEGGGLTVGTAAGAAGANEAASLVAVRHLQLPCTRLELTFRAPPCNM